MRKHVPAARELSAQSHSLEFATNICTNQSLTTGSLQKREQRRLSSSSKSGEEHSCDIAEASVKRCNGRGRDLIQGVEETIRDTTSPPKQFQVVEVPSRRSRGSRDSICSSWVGDVHRRGRAGAQARSGSSTELPLLDSRDSRSHGLTVRTLLRT